VPQCDAGDLLQVRLAVDVAEEVGRAGRAGYEDDFGGLGGDAVGVERAGRDLEEAAGSAGERLAVDEDVDGALDEEYDSDQGWACGGGRISCTRAEA
jgi:hypothetical protein